MGDRANPMKFGPEWLRHLAVERSNSSNGSNSRNSPPTGGGISQAGGSGHTTTTNTSIAGASGGNASGYSESSTAAANTSNMGAHSANNQPKVLLANSRYGKEEMLALYDRNVADPPSELRHNDLVYESRMKLPLALNNTFEADSQDGPRGQFFATVSSGERQGVNRARSLMIGDNRARTRTPLHPRATTARTPSWHSNPRMQGYPGGADDDAGAARSWTSSNGNNPNIRNGADQTDWVPSRSYRSKRLPHPHNNSNNWRQASREEGDVWRNVPDANRPRSSHQERRAERDWGERQSQDKPWISNRRSWAAGVSQNTEENLPEWAVANAESSAGTFDSSGAFLGCSSDDSALTVNRQGSEAAAFPLVRSNTHGNFKRSKTVEEGSAEWWASEKANKLLPKKFDASCIKSKKVTFQIPVSSDPGTNLSTNTHSKTNDEEEITEKPDKTNTPEPPEQETASGSAKNFLNPTVYNPKYKNNKGFDLCSEIDDEENEEGRNFQSVMIAPNNSLRQRHQNIVTPTFEKDNDSSQQSTNIVPLMMQLGTQKNAQEGEQPHQHQRPEDKIVQNIMDMTLEDKDKVFTSVPSSDDVNRLMNTPNTLDTLTSLGTMQPTMQIGFPNPGQSNQALSNHVLSESGNISNPLMAINQGFHGTGIQQPILQRLSSSTMPPLLGMPARPPVTMGIPLPNLPQSVAQNSGAIRKTALNQSAMPIGVMPGYPNSSALPTLPTNDIPHNSLFLGQNQNNSMMSTTPRLPMPNRRNQNNMYPPMHGLTHPVNQVPFGSSLYSNLMHSSQQHAANSTQNLADQWYYEDPKKIIQGPFSSKDMFSWYKAGFFDSSLMVRRAIETHMRPLGSYGPLVPFAPLNLLMMSNIEPTSPLDPLPFDSVGMMRNPPFGYQQSNQPFDHQRSMVESLWSRPTNDMWMQQAMNSGNDGNVNNLGMYFWDPDQSGTTKANPRLPDEIVEMNFEEQILAQLRANQSYGSTIPTTQFSTEPSSTLSTAVEEPKPFSAPNLEDLQKLLQRDMPSISTTIASVDDNNLLEQENLQTAGSEVAAEIQQLPQEDSSAASISQNITPQEPKQAKQTKNDAERPAKAKETTSSKNKKSKSKEEKKDDMEIKTKDEESSKSEKSSSESSPSKGKKVEKMNKKEIEKEKKEWIKEGFKIVKGTEKPSKDSKKKAEEAKAAEEAERKRKEEEKLAAEGEKRRLKQIETAKKYQDVQQRQATESVTKKAPWSAISNQAMQSSDKDGLTLMEIQRLEREKKLEQMKEQQQMMQLIAQQQAAALAREQEMQAGLGWAKNKLPAPSLIGQSLSEIQAETRKEAAAASAAAAVTTSSIASAAQANEEVSTVTPPPVNHVPWGGFWDTQGGKLGEKPLEDTKSVQPVKPKKKISLTIPQKKETTSPSTEFESWCTSALNIWSSSIDVPTFVGFLKDIESPYEVKDYVKCYLGEAKEANDFARLFLEKRSKLLRVGMVTPSDDLCSPAIAVNPRAPSISDYQEVKGKGKKSKKKMLKVDARILGFSVTAAEDRINVGDIDTV